MDNGNEGYETLYYGHNLPMALMNSRSYDCLDKVKTKPLNILQPMWKGLREPRQAPPSGVRGCWKRIQ